MELYKKSYKNNKFFIAAPTWNKKFELPDVLYSISDIQDHFEHIFRKHGEKTDNLSIRTYVNKIENMITLKIKSGWYGENGGNFPDLEIIEVMLVHCNIASNWLYDLIMSSTRFRVNPHFIFSWMSRNSLLESGAYLKFKWLQPLNPQPLSSETNTQPFSQTGQFSHLAMIVK